MDASLEASINRCREGCETGSWSTRSTAVGGCTDRHTDRGMRRGEQANDDGQDARDPRPIGDEDVDDTDPEEVDDGDHPGPDLDDPHEQDVDDQDPDYAEVR